MTRISYSDLMKGFGHAVPNATVNDFCSRLVEYLLSEGYYPVSYDGHQGPTRTGATAYTKEDVPFRTEPILIDDCRVGPDNTPVLKIVIRDAEGMNKLLHDTVCQLLAEYGITEPKDCARQPPEKGTRVYALRRS